MNKDIAKGDWKQVSGAIKHTWGKLTDDDLLRAKGDGEYLVGKLQEYYGLSKDKAEKSLKDLGYSLRTDRETVETEEELAARNKPSP